jgi:hypothetical protein
MVVISLDFLSRHFSYSNTSCVLFKPWLICHLGSWVKYNFIDKLTCMRIPYVRLVLPSALCSFQFISGLRAVETIQAWRCDWGKWLPLTSLDELNCRRAGAPEASQLPNKLFRLSWQRSFCARRWETAINDREGKFGAYMALRIIG